MTYFNTSNEQGRLLKHYRYQADSQEAKIVAWFRDASGFMYTPSEIRKYVFDNTVPLTSVRRAMSNLTTGRAPVKTDEKHAGPYGRRQCCWRRKIGNPAQAELLIS